MLLNAIKLQEHLIFSTGIIRFLAAAKADLTNVPYLLQGYIAFWRSLIFISSATAITTFKGVQIGEFFKFLWMSTYHVELVEIPDSTFFINRSKLDYHITDTFVPFEGTSVLLNLFLMQIFCAFLTYQTGKLRFYNTNEENIKLHVLVIFL